MQLEDFYAGGAWLRRWYINERGQAACWSPVETAATHGQDVAAIVAYNLGVRVSISAVEAYEAAKRIAAQPEPEKESTVYDEEGEPSTVIADEWKRWDEARREVAAADANLLALAKLRAEPPEDAEPVKDTFKPRPVSKATAEAVDAEHDRRAIHGRSFAVPGIGAVPLEGTERTQLVLLALKDSARDLRDAGVTAPLLLFTDRDGTDHMMTAAQMIDLVNAGKAWMQKVHAAKRDLKAMDPIPADFADDRHWPPMA
jgi:hypothetical protein